MAETGADLARECALWALPSNGTCAGVARRLLRQALERMGLPDDQIYDATLAVNELAANVYTHVLTRTRPTTPGPSTTTPGPSTIAPDASSARATSSITTADASPGIPDPTPAGAPELWLYRRGQNEDAQLVCKVFDPQREPRTRIPTQVTPAHEFQEHGRGLTIVKNLAANWGCHLTRSRLGGSCSIPGKAVWFAMPLPPWSAHRPPPRLTPAQAAHLLQSMLAARGIPGITRSDEWGQSTLVIRNTLKVRCQNATFTWTTNGFSAHYAFCDITETAEQLVRLHEELLSSPPIHAHAEE
ncbi:ATP-binding protein [Thermopolyspora sp. NPDC052614]|uniref:ATP-binding protein n=1 Tax=Thermopolyspora sp. NPDC052614 TaxID=3155682 RepID=UPI003412A400